MRPSCPPCCFASPLWAGGRTRFAGSCPPAWPSSSFPCGIPFFNPTCMNSEQWEQWPLGRPSGVFKVPSGMLVIFQMEAFYWLNTFLDLRAKMHKCKKILRFLQIVLSTIQKKTPGISLSDLPPFSRVCDRRTHAHTLAHIHTHTHKNKAQLKTTLATFN